MKKTMIILAASVAALGFSLCCASAAVVAPNTPVSVQQISQYLGAPTILACLGTNVPEGYVITKYEQSPACNFFPGILGIQQTFTNYEGLDTFTACSGSPYPKEGSEGGFVITENKISTDCVINSNTTGYASVYRSVSSMVNESGYDLEICTNSRMPDGWGADYIYTQIDSYHEQPCNDGFSDYIGGMEILRITSGSLVCSNKMRPPKNAVVIGVWDDPIFSRYMCGLVVIDDNDDNYAHGHVGPIKLEFLIPNSEPEIQVCSGFGEPPEGYILASTRRATNNDNCWVGRGDVENTDCPDGCENEPINGYIQTYKLPVYTILP